MGNAGNFGHSIVNPVPSLFTFNIKDSRIKDLMGVSAFASVKVKDTKLSASGPLLITHWGMSGPGILKLICLGRTDFTRQKLSVYDFVNWLNDVDFNECMRNLERIQTRTGEKSGF
jgi:predicted flavoprotein YhiN